MPARCHENIRWFDVAMDDSFRMRCVQRIRDLDSQLEQFLDGHRFAIDRMLERAPFEALHGDEPLAIALVDFVDGANVRMIQRRRRLRLALKSR